MPDRKRQYFFTYILLFAIYKPNAEREKIPLGIRFVNFKIFLLFPKAV